MDEVAAEHIDSDSIIHFGHSCLSSVKKLPVLYIFEENELDLDKLKHNFNNCFTEDDHVIIFYDVAFYHIYNDLCGR